MTSSATVQNATPRRANAGIEWYVRKHRREQEAAFWDESRLQAVATQSGATTTGVLVRFVAYALGLTAALGIIVSAIR